MLQIRKITPEDLGFVMELLKENNALIGRPMSNIESFLICESGRTKCGCGCIAAAGSEGFMSWVIVSEAHRGERLGSAIAKALLNIADLKGVDEVYAVGICGEFLTKLGFERQQGDIVVKEQIKEMLGFEDVSEYYRVSLKGYFKPCSQK